MIVTIRVYRDRVSNWRWRMTSRNGRIVGASSEGFVSRARALKNLRRVTGASIKSTKVRGNLKDTYWVAP